MAKMIEGVTENILKCAKEEFLINGYENASCVILPKKQAQRKAPCSIGIRTRRRYTTVLSSLLLMVFASCCKNAVRV